MPMSSTRYRTVLPASAVHRSPRTLAVRPAQRLRTPRRRRPRSSSRPRIEKGTHSHLTVLNIRTNSCWISGSAISKVSTPPRTRQEAREEELMQHRRLPERERRTRLGLARLLRRPLGGIAHAKILAERHSAIQQAVDGDRHQRPPCHAVPESPRSRPPSFRSPGPHAPQASAPCQPWPTSISRLARSHFLSPERSCNDEGVT